jgi:hypothetical protein
MDSHQRAMWNEMIERVSDFKIGRDDLGTLVRDLRGLFIEADPHDPDIRSEFEAYWSPIDGEHELRTEPWSPPGGANDAALARSLSAFGSWVAGVVQADATDEHR